MKKKDFYIANEIRLASKYVDLVLSGKKTSTIRRKYVLFNNIVIPLMSRNIKLNIRITKVDYSKTFGELTEEDAKHDGFNSLDELKSELIKYYADMTDDYPMTIIYFRVEE